MRSRFISVSGWLIAVILAAAMFVTGVLAESVSGCCDVQLRAYHSGYGVIVTQDKYNTTPTFYTFPFTSTAVDGYKLGNHYVFIDWSVSPPTVSIDPSSSK